MAIVLSPVSLAPPIAFSRSADGVVAVEGEVDAYTAPMVEEFVGKIVGPVRLDLRAVTFMDTSGLDVLDRICDRCRRNDRLFVIEARSPQVERLLRLVELCDAAPPEPAGRLGSLRGRCLGRARRLA